MVTVGDSVHEALQPPSHPRARTEGSLRQRVYIGRTSRLLFEPGF